MESDGFPPIPDPLDLEGLRDALLALPEPYRRDDVHRAVARLRLPVSALQRYLHWSDARHTRTRYHQGARFEILVLCWQEGQWSPIHDHARSLCSMLVLEGCAVTTLYRVEGSGDRRRLVEGETHRLPGGNVTTVYAGDIHRVGNPSGSGYRLITIHVYAPPIPEMLVWEEGNPEPRTVRAETLEPEPEIPAGR